MRRSAIVSFTSVLLVGLIAACATSPVDDPSLGADINSVKAPTEPTEDVKLPPPSTAPTATDAGTNTAKDASPPPQDASTPPQDASTPPPNTSQDCDPNDPTVLLKLFLGSGSGAACPCSAGECCLSGICI